MHGNNNILIGSKILDLLASPATGHYVLIGEKAWLGIGAALVVVGLKKTIWALGGIELARRNTTAKGKVSSTRPSKSKGTPFSPHSPN